LKFISSLQHHEDKVIHAGEVKQHSASHHR